MSRWNPLSPEERKAADRAKGVRYNERHRERRLAQWRASRKKRLAAKAIAEGRTPGVRGRERLYSDEERIAKARTHCLDYWKRNPEKRKELAKEYYENNKEKVLASSRNRRARKNAADGKHTPAEIRDLLRRQKGKCALCLLPIEGKRFHIDHYIPLIRGGSNDISNLRLLHPKCNLTKGAKDPIDHAIQCGMLCW